VNRQFAEKLIAEVPPIPCHEHIVSCDGGGGALGHPKVYINLVSNFGILVPTFVPIKLLLFLRITISIFIPRVQDVDSLSSYSSVVDTTTVRKERTSA
ncbi:NADH dehydrogenase (ubiquinone) Fe-S protein 6, partial [Paragonimus westermani]